MVEGATADVYVTFGEQSAGDLVAGEACGPYVHPDEVGSFEGGDGQMGQPLTEELPQGEVVVVEVDVEVVEPRLAVVVCGLQGDDAEGVDVAHLVDVDGTVNASACLAVVADDVGNLQTGGIERFRWRTEDDGLIVDGGEGCVVVAGHDEFAVYLVADDAHMVAPADVADAAQLIGMPYAADGVVGVAEHEECGFLVSAARFEGVVVNLVGVASLPQRVLHDVAAVVADAREEAVVDGCHDDDFLTGHGECLDDA